MPRTEPARPRPLRCAQADSDAPESPGSAGSSGTALWRSAQQSAAPLDPDLAPAHRRVTPTAALIGGIIGEEEGAAFARAAADKGQRLGQGGRGGLSDCRKQRRPPTRGKPKLPCPAGAEQLMVPRFPGELLVDGGNGPSRGLQ